MPMLKKSVFAFLISLFLTLPALAQDQAPQNQTSGQTAAPAQADITTGDDEFYSAFGPSDPFENIFETMRALQGEMLRRFAAYSPGAMEGTYAPSIDLKDTKDAFIVTADLPGMQKDQIEITVQNELLTLKGERRVEREKQDESQGYYVQERSYGSFLRTVTLPGRVDESKVTAKYENGVLTVHLPKAEPAQQGRQIQIQ